MQGAAPAEAVEVADIPAFAQPFVVVLLGLGAAAHPGDAPDLAISGKAKQTTAASTFYAFTPTVNHGGNRDLAFTVQNKPAWASFGKRHGTLYGVPKVADAGAYSNIIITVSDGVRTVALPAFSISVSPALTR
jgi:Putative Ig domain